MSRASSTFLILLGAQALAVFALVAWAGVLRLPIGTSEWAYRVNEEANPPTRLWPAAVVVAIAGGALAGLGWLRKESGVRRQETGERKTTAVAAVCRSSLLPFIPLIPAVVGLQVALWWTFPDYLRMLVGVQTSDVSAGYLSEAYRIEDPGEFLRAYPDRMAELPQHLATHPPGAVLYFYGVRKALEAAPRLSERIGWFAVRHSGVSSESVFRFVEQFPGASDLPDRTGAERYQTIAAALCSALGLGACGALACVLLAHLVWDRLPACHAARAGSDWALLTGLALGLTPSLLLFFQTLDQLLTLLCVAALFCVWGKRPVGAASAATGDTPAHNGNGVADESAPTREGGPSWQGLIAAGFLLSVALFVSLGAVLIVGLVVCTLVLAAAQRQNAGYGAQKNDTDMEGPDGEDGPQDRPGAPSGPNGEGEGGPDTSRDAPRRARSPAPPDCAPPDRLRLLAGWLGWLGLGLLIGFVGWLALGVNPIAVFRGGLQAHAALAGAESHRTYALWVWMNVVEVAVFLGLPLTVLAVFALGRHVRDLARRRCSVAGLMLISSVLCLLLLTISGVVRGETGRLLMFIMPGLAAGAIAAVPPERRTEILTATFGLLGSQLLLMALLMHPVTTPF